MRTRAQMVTKVRRFIQDSKKGLYANDDDIVVEMQRAATTIWDMFLADNRGNRLLQKWQAPRGLLAQITQYPVPSDCMRLLGVEYRYESTLYATLTCGATGATLAAWKAVTKGSVAVYLDYGMYRLTGLNFAAATSLADVASILQAALRVATGGTETVTHATDHFVFAAHDTIGYLDNVEFPATGNVNLAGAGYLNGAAGGVAVPYVSTGVTEFGPVPLGDKGEARSLRPYYSALQADYADYGAAAAPAGWHPVTPNNRYVSIYPRSSATVPGVYRMVYLARPAFPAAEHLGFYDLPDGADDLVEYLTAINLFAESIEGKGNLQQVQFYGNTFSGKLATYVAGAGGGNATPPRRYVHMVEA